MMPWSIRRGSTTIVELFTIFGAVTGVISLLFTNGMLFFASCLLLVFGLYPRWYLNYISKHFSFENEKEKVYLARGSSGELRLSFANHAKLPVVFATVELAVDDHVHIGGVKKWIGKQYQFEISLKASNNQSFSLPIEALTRGVAKVKNLKVKLYDPMHLLSLTLSQDFIRKEVVIYPEQKPVRGSETLKLPIEGDHPHPTSLFQDVTSPIGTREYLPSDPLKHVHWKASARTGQLQTKIFEKTVGMTWTFVILLSKELTKANRLVLENQLSYVATLVHEASERGIDTEIFINTKPMGRSLVHHLEAGCDRHHVIKAMEFLALIQPVQMKTLPLEALREMDRTFRERRVILIIDQVRQTAPSRFYQKWLRNGHALYFIDPEGMIIPISAGGERLAT